MGKNGSGKTLIRNPLSSLVWKYLRQVGDHTQLGHDSHDITKTQFLPGSQIPLDGYIGCQDDRHSSSCSSWLRDRGAGQLCLFHNFPQKHVFYLIDFDWPKCNHRNQGIGGTLTLPEHISWILEEGWYPRGILHLLFPQNPDAGGRNYRYPIPEIQR